MEQRDRKASATPERSGKQNGPEASKTGGVGPHKEAWTAYVRDVQGGAEGGDAGQAESEGGGQRRMYTVAMPVAGRDQIVYLGRWYYQNVSVAQAKSYEAHATTTGGWFEITKIQYEIQHGATNKKGEVTRKANPAAWTYNVRGPGGQVVQKSKMNFTNGVQADDKTFFTVDQTDADLELRLSEPAKTECNAVVEALDANGRIRTVDTLHFKAGQSVAQGHYTLAAGESLRIVMDTPDSPAITAYSLVKTSTKGAPGEQVSNMEQYGKQRPTETDVQDALELRKHGKGKS